MLNYQNNVVLSEDDSVSFRYTFDFDWFVSTRINDFINLWTYSFQRSFS